MNLTEILKVAARIFTTPFLLCGFLLTQGCTLTPPPRPHEIFVLNPETNVEPSSRTAKFNLYIPEIEATQILKETKILFSREEYSRGWYQYAMWEEPVTKKIKHLLVLAFEKTGAFETIHELPLPGEKLWTLELTLEEFFHDAKTNPGFVKTEIKATLKNPYGQLEEKKKTFFISEPVQSYDTKGAVRAMNKSLEKALPEITRWVISAVPG